MEIKKVDAALLSRMIIAGAKNLDSRREWINELNVFPVPDGDTGTNMCMTIFSAIHEMENSDDKEMIGLSMAMASGSLRGARGNSGVILSQLMRGFAKGIEEYPELDKIVIADALQRACETAYKAVMKPKEGTVLTVARAVADIAMELAYDDSCSMGMYFDKIIAEAESVLKRTPDMLPVLKQAGVVDAGGQGLVEILRGARDAFLGREIDYTVPEATPEEQRTMSAVALSTEEIVFGYCTEFIINLDREMTDEEESEYRAFLNSMGDSIVLVTDDSAAKTHVHTNDPGLVIQRALSLGSLSSIKIDNMREQHQEKLFADASRLAREQAEEAAALKAEKEHAEEVCAQDEPDKEFGFIAVSSGDGMKEVFLGLGADCIIEGGQTMNPSTEDLMRAIDQVKSRTVYLFPNNKNIILAANQAASMTEDKEVVVIPTTTLPEGITALINFVPDSGVEANRQLMTEVIGMVKTGQVTYAIRDTAFDGIEIKEGDYMGIGKSSILSAGKEIDDVVKDMMKALIDEESSFISIYYGEDTAREDAEMLGESLEETYPNCDVEVQYGGQPIYYYIVSVE